jgi:formylglycine-generating enzyme required for sulfatase activity
MPHESGSMVRVVVCLDVNRCDADADTYTDLGVRCVRTRLIEPDRAARTDRGGNWCHGAACNRAANRNFDFPDSDRADLGFRCMRRVQ